MQTFLDYSFPGKLQSPATVGCVPGSALRSANITWPLFHTVLLPEVQLVPPRFVLAISGCSLFKGSVYLPEVDGLSTQGMDLHTDPCSQLGDMAKHLATDLQILACGTGSSVPGGCPHLEFPYVV